MSDFNFDLIRMKEAVESNKVSIPSEALSSFESFDEWINSDTNNYTNLRGKLPNPFTTDYQYENGPLDLYTETEMLKFAETIIHDILGILSGPDAMQCTKNIKEHFGIC